MEKRVLILLADGFEEIEALTPADYLRRVGVDVTLCAIGNERLVRGAHDIRVEADVLLENLENSDEFDMLILPGGMPGSTNLRDDDRVIRLVRAYDEAERWIGAICAAPIILEKAGITEGRAGTSYPGFEKTLGFRDYREDVVVRDGHLITARGPAAAVFFALELARVLVGSKTADKLKNDILQTIVEKQLSDHC